MLMNNYRLIQGSAHSLPQIADASVQCVATSPPYFGLRSYDGDQSIEWPTVEYSPMPGLPPIRIQGCEPGCVHEWADGPTKTQAEKRDHNGRDFGDTRNQEPARQNTTFKITHGAYCVHCGGWRGGLGLEPDPFFYIGHLILCLREWRRVLHPTGLVWVNLGDSYAAGKMGRTDHGTDDPTSTLGPRRTGIPNGTQPGPVEQRKAPPGLKPKNLMQIPQRFALAAQADGWYLRSAIVWAKGVSFLPDYAGSCMPESVTSRPTQSYEMVYMLAKNERYFYDNEAVKEGVSSGTHGGAWTEGGQKQTMLGQQKGGMLGNSPDTGRRNLRNVWVINPQPTPMAHFATWPPKLVEPMIKASTSERGCCAACGASWARVVERTSAIAKDERGTDGTSAARAVNGNADRNLHNGSKWYENAGTSTTTGWQPTCTCAADVVPCVVLDPFAGSGTTLQVAVRLGRHAIGVDLSQAYLDELVPERMDTVSLEPKQLSGRVEDLDGLPMFAAG